MAAAAIALHTYVLTYKPSHTLKQIFLLILMAHCHANVLNSYESEIFSPNSNKRENGVSSLERVERGRKNRWDCVREGKEKMRKGKRSERTKEMTCLD